jgi:hypothetical protein
MRVRAWSVLGVARGLGAKAVEGWVSRSGGVGGVRGRVGRMNGPLADDENEKSETDQRIEDRHEPSDKAEALFRGLDVDGAAVFGDEGVDDLLLGFAFVEMLIDFLEHGLGGVTRAGERAARVGAKTGAHVAAAAHAFDVCADLFGVLRVAGLGEEERSEGEKEKSREECEPRGATTC